MVKTVRKEYFEAAEGALEAVLSAFLQNANWQDIKLGMSSMTAHLRKTQPIGMQRIGLQFKLDARFVEQGNGTNVTVTVEEATTEWSQFACDCFCDFILASLRNVQA